MHENQWPSDLAPVWAIFIYWWSGQSVHFWEGACAFHCTGHTGTFFWVFRHSEESSSSLGLAHSRSVVTACWIHESFFYQSAFSSKIYIPIFYRKDHGLFSTYEFFILFLFHIILKRCLKEIGKRAFIPKCRSKKYFQIFLVFIVHQFVILFLFSRTEGNFQYKLSLGI